MRKISLVTSLMIILFSNTVLATTVNTDYAGSGDLSIQTTIISPVVPIITDSANINTGCAGGCCCCPDCAGEYEGEQIVTNNPFSASGHEASVTNGCVEINQKYTDKIDGQTIETSYHTYMNGTGTAESYVYAIPGHGTSYQLANGTGSAFVGFTQLVFLDDEFDYGTSYGGGVWLCSPGYAGLLNRYDLYNGNIIYDSQLGLYCYPVDGSSLYAFLFAKTTDSFSLNSDFVMDSTEYAENIEAEGASEYGSVITSYNGSFNYDFGMELGW